MPLPGPVEPPKCDSPHALFPPQRLWRPNEDHGAAKWNEPGSGTTTLSIMRGEINLYWINGCDLIVCLKQLPQLINTCKQNTLKVVT